MFSNRVTPIFVGSGMGTSVVLKNNYMFQRQVTSFAGICQSNLAQNLSVVFCVYYPKFVQKFDVQQGTLVGKNSCQDFASFYWPGLLLSLHSLLAYFDSGSISGDNGIQKFSQETIIYVLTIQFLLRAQKARNPPGTLFHEP